jgi:predicted phosphodiesterase
LTAPGRTCPLSYRYAPESLRRTPELAADTVWIAGGLYGNPFALESLLALYERERGTKALVFNGDFHWFDVDPQTFSHIDAAVTKFHALRGNVETELAVPGDGAGCGCAYPDWVDNGTVERSNAIIERLRAAARDTRALAALPMHLVAQVGEARVAIVHGDFESLAGWGFSQETLSTSQGRLSAHEAFDRAQVDIFASSHTCLPVLQRFGASRAIVNNGSAGMPNFRGELYGVVTRISIHPSDDALYRLECNDVHVEAIALRYDQAAWEKRFLEWWPAGSPAHRSYYGRITNGPSYVVGQALREELFRDERRQAERGKRAEHAGR